MGIVLKTCPTCLMDYWAPEVHECKPNHLNFEIAIRCEKCQVIEHYPSAHVSMTSAHLSEHAGDCVISDRRNLAA